MRGRLFLALLAIIVLMCVVVFAAYRIRERSRERPAPRQPPRGPVTTSAAPSPRPTTAPSPTPAAAVTLALTVTGPSCQVFVRVPGGDILVNRSLVRGQSVRLDEQRLSIVLGDASAVRVYVNGKLRPAGKAGRRVTFTALKG